MFLLRPGPFVLDLMLPEFSCLLLAVLLRPGVGRSSNSEEGRENGSAGDCDRFHSAALIHANRLQVL